MNRARAREGGGERDLRSYLTSTSKLSFNLETSIKNGKFISGYNAYTIKYITILLRCCCYDVEQLVRSLVARTTECKRGVAYRPVDYVALFEKVQTTRNRDRERLVKVNHLSRKGELIRESGLLKTHKDIWKKEQSRLEYERQQVGPYTHVYVCVLYTMYVCMCIYTSVCMYVYIYYVFYKVGE